MEDQEFLLDCVEEAIDFILEADRHILKTVLGLVNAIREDDKEAAQEILDYLNTNRYHLFDDGLWHLPSEPLQDLVAQVMEIAEGMNEEEE